MSKSPGMAERVSPDCFRITHRNLKFTFLNNNSPLQIPISDVLRNYIGKEGEHLYGMVQMIEEVITADASADDLLPMPEFQDIIEMAMKAAEAKLRDGKLTSFFIRVSQSPACRKALLQVAFLFAGSRLAAESFRVCLIAAFAHSPETYNLMPEHLRGGLLALSIPIQGTHELTINLDRLLKKELLDKCPVLAAREHNDPPADRIDGEWEMRQLILITLAEGKLLPLDIQAPLQRISRDSKWIGQALGYLNYLMQSPETKEGLYFYALLMFTLLPPGHRFDLWVPTPIFANFTGAVRTICGGDKLDRNPDMAPNVHNTALDRIAKRFAELMQSYARCAKLSSDKWRYMGFRASDQREARHYRIAVYEFSEAQHTTKNASKEVEGQAAGEAGPRSATGRSSPARPSSAAGPRSATGRSSAAGTSSPARPSSAAGPRSATGRSSPAGTSSPARPSSAVRQSSPGVKPGTGVRKLGGGAGGGTRSR